MGKYYPPQFQEKQFNCTYCGVFAAQYWNGIYYASGSSRLLELPGWTYCECMHCNRKSVWLNGRMNVPSDAPAPPAHEDFPEGPKEDFEEARDIVGRSPKAAAALLRLSLQKLLAELGEKGENINDDIKSLVKKGVPEYVQQALDFCRVVGNNAVHPGEILLDDTPDVALALFEMLNVIVETRIAQPKRIAARYEELPEAARKAIERRDGKGAS